MKKKNATLGFFFQRRCDSSSLTLSSCPVFPEDVNVFPLKPFHVNRRFLAIDEKQNANTCYQVFVNDANFVS